MCTELTDHCSFSNVLSIEPPADPELKVQGPHHPR